MFKYLWLSILIGILVFSFFSDFIVSSKTNLASLIQLEALDEPQLVSQNNREALVAKVYSTYPFNHRNLLTVNAGAADAVVAGMPVTIDGNFLLGQVIEVSENESVVRTIFDKDFTLSVKAGIAGVDALLVGGSQPALKLIEKNSEVSQSDLVYSAGRDFPYGLKIGKVGQLEDAVADAFKVALLELPYQANYIEEVAILLK